VDPYSPMDMWDRLLPQAEMTLNLLRTSRLHPQLSAAAHFHGLVDYNKTAFSTPGCKIIAHEKPSQRRTWAPQPGYSLGTTMYYYRCQNVYITSTASKRIVETLEFFPHNSPMPQISSTDQLLISAHDMTDALKHTHPDVTFPTIGYETIMALTTLEAIFKNKFKKPLAPVIIDFQIKAAYNKCPSVLIQPIITSPTKHNYQTRSHPEVNKAPFHFIESQNSPQIPRVVTPEARRAAPPTVPARARNLSPRNLSQGDFLDMGSANHAMASANTNVPMMNSVPHPAIGNKMEYKDIMKHPILGPQYQKGLGNKLGRICQENRDIQGTHMLLC
jgi:hypothetical protein